jgi:cell division protein FtsL
MVRRKLPRKEIAAAAFCILLAVATLTFYIWHQAAVIQIGFQTSRLVEKRAGLEEEIKKLETDKAALLAPVRVDRIAREELGLIEPQPGQIIYEGNRPAHDHE